MPNPSGQYPDIGYPGDNFMQHIEMTSNSLPDILTTILLFMLHSFHLSTSHIPVGANAFVLDMIAHPI